jgi:hypothetical protein
MKKLKAITQIKLIENFLTPAERPGTLYQRLEYVGDAVLNRKVDDKIMSAFGVRRNGSGVIR